MNTEKFSVVAALSSINWTGKKENGAHSGSITLKKGELFLNGGELAGGYFIIDTTSITVFNIADPVTNAQVAGHLASNDFFATETYPEAFLAITSVEHAGLHHYRLHGDLTIRSSTRPVIFHAIVQVSDGVLIASGRLSIDRTNYGIDFHSEKYCNEHGGILIHDVFDIDVKIIARTSLQAIHRVPEPSLN